MPHLRSSFARDLVGITHLRFAPLVGLSVTILLAACASAMRRQVVNPAGISPLVPAYSVGIRHGDVVFVSGMTGIEPGTQDIIDGGVAVQTRQTLENIRTTLQTAGATMADVGECTVFLVDMADYSAMNTATFSSFRSIHQRAQRWRFQRCQDRQPAWKSSAVRSSADGDLRLGLTLAEAEKRFNVARFARYLFRSLAA